MIKAVPGAEGAKLDWKERVVKVGKAVAFKQGKDDLGGFEEPYCNLKLP